MTRSKDNLIVAAYSFTLISFAALSYIASF